MRKFFVAFTAAMFAAALVIAPAAAQQCPKGQTWDYGSQSCK